MDHFYERNISEIKHEYTTMLVNCMTPFIYEGIMSVYQFALNSHAMLVEKGKHDPNIEVNSELKLFQLNLKEIPTLNNNSIEIEVNRIKSGCKCSDWFDDLVRATIKSTIILLVFANTKKKRYDILKEEYHNKIEIKDFVHKCYIEASRAFYNNPELFSHKFPSLEIKRNQREACEIIKIAINQAIKKMLPIKLILKEYLQNNFIDEDNLSDNQYMNVHNMVKRDLYGGVPEEILSKGALITESSSSSSNKSNPSESTTSNSKEKSEDLMEESSSSSSSSTHIEETDEATEKKFLEDLAQNLETLEKSQDQQPEIKEEIEQPVAQPKVSEDAVKELLNKANTVTTFEKLTKKPSKRELEFTKQILDQIKPQEPDRKLFFEQYMK